MVVVDERDGADDLAPAGLPLAIDRLPERELAQDLTKTVELFKEEIANAKTIVWNGPLGVFEMEPFAQGTEAVADAVANSAATTVIGGGETATAVKDYNLTQEMTHVSTGGGASLDYLAGETLPGIAALDDE